jgi:hypothetical protein
MPVKEGNLVYRWCEAAEENIGNVNKEYVVFEDLLELSKSSKAVQEDDVERSDC